MQNENDLLEELRLKAAALLEAKDKSDDKSDEEKLDGEDDEIEDGEELDELSKATLGSYIKKASTDARGLQGSSEKNLARAADYSQQSDAYLKSGHRELAAKMRARAGAYSDDSTDREKRSDSRLKGVHKAVNKLTKESEQFDISSVFEGEELTEEFKIKMTALFEAAVAQKVSAIEEAYAQALEESEAERTQRALAESVELTEGLVERVDGYLDYMVEQWMENNEIALERGIKADLFESFMSGMKGLFEEHMINVPAEELHVLSEQQSVIEELESKIDRVLAENVALKRDIKAIAKHEQIMEAASGLSELEAERFMILAEELSFDNEDVFGKKLGVIREQFFAEDAAQTLTESVITDSPVINEETVVRKPQADSRVAAYANALSRTTI